MRKKYKVGPELDKAVSQALSLPLRDYSTDLSDSYIALEETKEYYDITRMSHGFEVTFFNFMGESFDGWPFAIAKTLPEAAAKAIVHLDELRKQEQAYQYNKALNGNK